jgi:hypothetical protein
MASKENFRLYSLGLASLCFDWTEQELEEEDALRLWL